MEQNRISVLVPAYNEELVIRRCLKSILKQKNVQCEVFVLCNGSSDKTFEIVQKEYPNVKVININKASKTNALNVGDTLTSLFPRAYVDADIELNDEFVFENCLHTLRAGALATAPRIDFRVEKASFLMKRFTQYWKNDDYFDAHVIGCGFYMLSEAGRLKFEEFPDIIADDEFVRRQFKKEERLVSGKSSFSFFMPTKVLPQLKRMSRVKLGNLQLKKMFPTDAAKVKKQLGFREKLRLFRLRVFNDVFGYTVYKVFNIVTGFLSLGMYLRNDYRWNTDESSRNAEFL